MSYLYPHRFWLALLALALAAMLSSEPLLRVLRAEAARNLAATEARRAETEQALRQLQDDIAAVKKLSGQIGDAEAARLLAPADRLRAAAALEREAAEARLGHFTYTLSPPEKVNFESGGGAPQELALSTISVAADAPLDLNVYHYIDGLRHALPGRVRVQQLAIERIKKDGDPEIYNLHFGATIEWLSNPVAENVAGGL